MLRGERRALQAVFVRVTLLPHVSRVESATVVTGLGHVIANKAGVGVAFCLGRSSMAFVNAHFQADQGNVTGACHTLIFLFHLRQRRNICAPPSSLFLFRLCWF